MKFTWKKIAMGVLLSLNISAHADLFTGQYGQSQVFDVARSGCSTVGGSCSVYNFISPFIAPYTNWTHVTWATGDYIKFVDTGTLISSKPNLQLIQYDSAGNQKQVVSASGYIAAIGDGIVYIGVPTTGGGTGYFISNSVGIDPTQYRSSSNFSLPVYSPTITYTSPSLATLQSYTTSSTPLAAGQTLSSSSTPTLQSTAAGADIVSTSTSNGTTTTTTVVSRGTTASVSVTTDTRDRQTKVLNINRNITITDTTPVTTTVTQTTPVTTTTVTTPTTIETYSDGSTVTVNGTSVTTTSTTDSVVSNSTTVDDVQVTSTDTLYATRIDQFSILEDANRRENSLLVSDPLVRHRIYDGEIKLMGANVNERTVFEITGVGSNTNTVDQYKLSTERYSVGLGHLVRTDLMIGGQFSQVNIKLSGNDSTGALHKDAINLYSLYTRNDWLVKSDIGYSKNGYNTSHSLPDLDLYNTASANGQDVWMQVRLYTPSKQGFRLFVGVRKERDSRDYAEDSGSALSAVDYSKSDSTQTTREAGLRFDHYFNDKTSTYFEYSQNNEQLQTGKVGLSYLSGKNTTIQIGGIQQRQNGWRNDGIMLELKMLF